MSQPIVAALQMTSLADVGRNLATARRLLTEARDRGACLAVLPENFSFMGRNEAERRAVVERDGEGPAQEAMAAAARELGLWIVAGTQPVAVPGDSRPANACIVYDDRGRRAARYDKIHLFDVDLPTGESWRESLMYEAGKSAVIVPDTPVGKLGLTICYDLRFPELFQRLSEAGAEVISVPAAFTVPTGRAHWQVLMRARAIEAELFVVAAAQAGRHEDGRETYGHSLVADPWGEIILEMGGEPGMAFAELDLARIADVRARIPVHQHRRPIGPVAN